MSKLTKWLASNGYTHEVQRLTSGGQCVFVKLHQITSDAEKNAYAASKQNKATL
jgi:hypothetical protein